MYYAITLRDTNQRSNTCHKRYQKYRNLIKFNPIIKTIIQFTLCKCYFNYKSHHPTIIRTIETSK